MTREMLDNARAVVSETVRLFAEKRTGKKWDDLSNEANHGPDDEPYDPGSTSNLITE